jgi:hypothetical protein
MKKLFAVIAVAAFIISLSSCKTHEKCPAYGKYGKANTVKTDGRVTG